MGHRKKMVRQIGAPKEEGETKWGTVRESETNGAPKEYGETNWGTVSRW